MTERLRLELLGGLQVILGGSALGDFTSKKSLALLVYLALTERTHSRETLSGLLWGESNASQARASLRTVLWDLRQQLPSFVVADRQTISFDPGSRCWIDAVVLREAVERALQGASATSADHESRPRLSDRQIRSLEEAASLYRGDLLDGFFVVDAPAFEDWMLAERERVRQLVLQTLHRLLVHYKQEAPYRKGIDVASRLLAIAPWQEEIHRELMRLLVLDGQRSAALMQYETCREMLAEELGVEPTLQTRLLYRRIKAGKRLDQEQSDAFVAGLNVGTTCLDHPSGADTLIGRDDETAALKRKLSDGPARLVSLVGAEGVGRSRLAWSVAQQVASSFGDGVWYVSLAPEGEAVSVDADAPVREGPRSEPRSEGAVATRIARQLGLTTSVRSPASRRLLDYLGQREMLLIIDEFSSSLEEVDLLQDILRHAPYLRLLVVARQPLGVQGEQTLNLAGLQLPPSADAGRPVWDRLEELLIYDSVRLLVERAARAAPGFELTSRNAQFVVRLCRSAAGLPLSTELAAPWVGNLDLREMTRTVEGRLQSSRSRPDDGGDLPRALRALFFHAWDHLSSSGRRALSRLTFFRDPFEVRAASAIAGVSAAALERLAHKHLLVRPVSGRYGWHRAVHRLVARASGRPSLMPGAEGPADTVDLRERYRSYYLDILAHRTLSLSGEEARATLAEIECDWAHVRRAWIWAVADLDVESLARSLQGLSNFLLTQGWLQEGTELLEWAAQRVEDVPDADTDGERTILLIRLLIEHARLLNQQWLSDRAQRQAESAIERIRAQRDNEASPDDWSALQAAAYRESGRALYAQGQLRAAQERLREALAANGEGGSPDTRASILTYLGEADLELGDPNAAREHLEEALTLCEERVPALGRGQVLHQMALAAAVRGDLATARTHAQDALRLSQAIGDRRLESAAHTDLGRVAAAQEDYGTASAHCEQALRIARDRADSPSEARALTECALIHLRQGTTELAWRRSLLAVELARASGDWLTELRALVTVGQAFTELGMSDAAVDAYQRAQALQAGTARVGRGMEILAGLARAHLAKGDLAQARKVVEELLSRLERADPAGAADPMRVYLTCYQVLEAVGDPRARRVLRTASGLYEGDEHQAAGPPRDTP